MSDSGTRSLENPDRLLALSDGVYAIALTLLVLGISVHSGLSPEEFRHALGETVPQLLSYALSFVVIAGFWLDHHRILNTVKKSNAVLARLVLVSLGLVALLPFPTVLLADYASQPQAVAIYALAVAAVHTLHLGIRVYLQRHPALLTAPWAREEIRFYVLEQLATLAVLLLSVPIAFASASAGKYTWLALIPVRLAIGRHQRRRQVSAGEPGEG